jgi:hypothetical protein
MALRELTGDSRLTPLDANALTRLPRPPVTRRYDCEDRQRSLMVVGCGLVATGVTLGMTGFGALP